MDGHGVALRVRYRRRGTALIYRLLSRVTERFPARGAAAVDTVLFATYGNPVLHRAIHARDRHRVGTTHRRICVLADLNIGDAIIGGAAVAALRDFFPAARIDYAVNPRGAPLLAGDLDASTVVPVYRGGPFPDERDREAVNALLARGGYDLVLALSPFLAPARIAVPPHTAAVGYLGLAAHVVEAQRDPDALSHMIVQTAHFVHGLFADRMDPARPLTFHGARVAVPAEAAEATARFLDQAGLAGAAPPVLVNPDTSSPFTRIPEELLVRVVAGLADGTAPVLLEQGRLNAGVERRIVDALPATKRRRVTLVPAALTLDVYAALIDACAVFIAGDGGPVHIAAARKRARGDTWAPRNRTAVFSVFGATPARVYGYDSTRPGYLAADQDAPSRAFVAESRYRTFAHINKGAIVGRDPRCFFEGLDPDAVVVAAREIAAPSDTLPVRRPCIVRAR